MESGMIPGSDQPNRATDPEEGVLSPEEVLAERERVLAEREQELKRREQLLNMQPTQRALSEAEHRDQQVVTARLQADYYCPGCGKHAAYQKECQGTGTAPHPPIEMVSTQELHHDDPSKHTAAPGSTA